MQKFTVEHNKYLSKDVEAFFHSDYLRYQEPGNPDYLNVLKNDFNDREVPELQEAVNTVGEILNQDLPDVLKELNWNEALVCTMPRAKKFNSYKKNQKLFSKVVSVVIEDIEIAQNGISYIRRNQNTRTTHLKWSDTDGDMPYVGITEETCEIDSDVKGKNILLIDDIYTKTVNVNEDMIQALFDKGARSVALYVVAKTKYRKQ